MRDRFRHLDSQTDDERQRETDAKFVRLVLLAIWRGENLPAGVPKPLRLIG